MMNNVGRPNSPPIPLGGSVEEDDEAVGLGEGWVVEPKIELEYTRITNVRMWINTLTDLQLR